MIRYVYFILCLIAISCSEKAVDINEAESNSLYFPSTDSDEWQNKSPEEINWNTSAIDTLYNFLEQRNTRAFILLKDGKIVLVWCSYYSVYL